MQCATPRHTHAANSLACHVDGRYDLVDELAGLLRDSTIAIRACLCSGSEVAAPPVGNKRAVSALTALPSSNDAVRFPKQCTRAVIEPSGDGKGGPADGAALSAGDGAASERSSGPHGAAALASNLAALRFSRNSVSPMRGGILPHLNINTAVCVSHSRR